MPRQDNHFHAEPVPGYCRRLPNLGRALAIGWLIAGAGWPARGAEPEPAGPEPTAEAQEFFEKQVRPLLAEHCWKCHGANKQQHGLRLDSRPALLKGSENGPVIVPGDAAASKLIAAIHYEGDLQMPPDGKLPAAAIEALTRWVQLGVPFPASAETPAAQAVDWKQHWAFQPIKAPPLADVQHGEGLKSEIDRFIVARLAGVGLTMSPPADRRAMIRRLSFDLVGLPPTVAEMQEFVTDDKPEAVARLVDRLLASAHYGERWGRYWLDVARYADTKGYLFEEERRFASAYTYRDWVVQALNDDMPYDQFLIRQIAADRLPSASDPKTLAALGFLTLGRRFLNVKADIIDDRIDVLTRGTMALTVGCARCHDHKFDPISTQDYYALYGVFDSTTEPKDPPGQITLVDSPDPHNAHVFVRGNPGNLGDLVPRRFLSCLSGPEPKPFEQGSGRLELAQAIASRANPLTARVIVNRVWLSHLGAPLVDTPSDFGLRSQPPTHPELLDYLAARFMDEGWSLKKLHRWLVVSSVYQQSSADREEGRLRDPENRLLWRMNRRRLDFEALRDAVLATAGNLDPAMGGPSVELTAQPFTARRTIYGYIDRQNLPGMFRVFDFAGPDTHSPRRFTTTVPQQALFLLNSPFLLQEARLLAARPDVVEVNETSGRIERLFRAVLGRPPTSDEMQMALAYVQGEFAATASAPPLWQYGYGAWDESAKRLQGFTVFDHFQGSTWQPGDKLPDARHGWLTLNSEGGHPGLDAAHAVVRRWNAPQDGAFSVEGQIHHPAPQGDGVEAHVVSSRAGEVGHWVAEHGKVDAGINRIELKQGDSLDFVVVCRSSDEYDAFVWAPVVRRVEAVAGAPADASWDAKTGFSGPPIPSAEPWHRLAQALLLTNEFIFLD